MNFRHHELDDSEQSNPSRDQNVQAFKLFDVKQISRAHSWNQPDASLYLAERLKMSLCFSESATLGIYKLVYKVVRKAIFNLARVETTARSLAVWNR